MGNLVELFPLRQSKRWNQALEHLAESYSAHLAAEEAILHALIQIGWEDDGMTRQEEGLARVLKKRAEFLKQSAKHIRNIMRDIASQVEGYEVELGESED
jgi:hypothetical protein